MASKILHLPEYCNLFKQLLVEEIVFYESPFDYHYGKCSVIGKLCIKDQMYYLQNISLGCLDKEYCLKTGSAEILLLPTAYRSNSTDISSLCNLINGSFYEVHGETVFSVRNHPEAPVKTTEEMIISLRINNLSSTENTEDTSNLELKDISMSLSQLSETKIEADLQTFMKNHVPALQVHTINEIDQAEEVIHCNLQLRLLRNKRRHINY